MYCDDVKLTKLESELFLNKHNVVDDWSRMERWSHWNTDTKGMNNFNWCLSLNNLYYTYAAGICIKFLLDKQINSET